MHFSDGCAGQYKCKINFVDASFSVVEHGVPMEKQYFGSRHGKGPCDAEIGVVKCITTQDMKRRKAIVCSAHDFYDYAKKSLTGHLLMYILTEGDPSMSSLSMQSTGRGKTDLQTSRLCLAQDLSTPLKDKNPT